MVKHAQTIRRLLLLEKDQEHYKKTIIELQGELQGFINPVQRFERELFRSWKRGKSLRLLRSQWT